MSESSVEEVAAEVVEEAKGEFDLGATLRGRASLKSTKTLRLHPDEDALEALAEVLVKKSPLEREKNILSATLDSDALKDSVGDSAQGIIDRIAEIDAELADLAEDEADARATLEGVAIELAVTPLPPLIVKSARREARKHLGLKKVTADDFEEYIPEFNAQILHSAVVGVTQVATGATNKTLSLEDARDLLGYLPESEVARLDQHVDKVVFRSEVTKTLAQDADF